METKEEMTQREEDVQKGKYLTFFLGDESYAIDIEFVTEIIGIQAVTYVPELPEYIKGIINLRGKIIPIMDVRARFRKEPRDYNERTSIIVIDIRDLSIGLIIDTVSEVIDIPEKDIAPPPQFSKEYGHHYIQGVAKVENGIKLLLDCEKLISLDEE